MRNERRRNRGELAAEKQLLLQHAEQLLGRLPSAHSDAALSLYPQVLLGDRSVAEVMANFVKPESSVGRKVVFVGSTFAGGRG
jgi:hypothetical protein